MRTVPHIYDARTRLTELITARDFPLGLRREALRALAEHQDGGPRIIELARDGKLPDDLKTEAVTLLITHRDRQVRDRAASVLPLPKIAGGRPLPPIGELIRRDGDADEGTRRLLPDRPELLRELPPRPGPGPVGRPRPLDDRHQVRQG